MKLCNCGAVATSSRNIGGVKEWRCKGCEREAESEDMVTPVAKTILGYPGAKWNIADWICGYLPQTQIFLEPYCGSAAVYLRLPWQPENAVLNDMSADVTNLFRVIREGRGMDLAALIEMTPYSRDEYELSWQACSDELERARRFLVRSWMAQAGQLNHHSGWRRQGVSLSYTTPVGKWLDLPPRILATIDRLRQAEIENRPALDVITQHAAPNVLIYADPPYPLSTRTSKMYQHEMMDVDHLALLDALDAHPGPVALSGYHCELYDTRLARWTAKEQRAQVNRGGERTEVLWLNPACVDCLGYGPLFTLLAV